MWRHHGQLTKHERRRLEKATHARIKVVLSENGRELCGLPGRHPYELYSKLEDIQHRTTKVKRLQSNRTVARFPRTLLEAHFRVEGWRTWFQTIDEMQVALAKYLVTYNRKRPDYGLRMNDRTP